MDINRNMHKNTNVNIGINTRRILNTHTDIHMDIKPKSWTQT